MGPLLNFLWILSIGLVASACGQTTQPPVNVPVSATVCPANVAQILVADGFLMNLCGCTQTGQNGTQYPIPGGLVCNIASSTTTVRFIFSGDQVQHQIIPAAGSQFTPSPVIKPGRSSLQVYVAFFTQGSGTYSFQDASTGMTGQIIVP